MQKTLGLLTILTTAACATGDGREPTSREQAAVTTAANIWLTSSLLARLQQRAAANDPAWTALAAHCNALTTGTFEVPSGNAYPDAPNVGQGYQGDGYAPEIFSLGLCYRVAAGVNATAAASYAKAGARLLTAMATPVGSGGQSPSTDSGYGIRNYGVGMAVGYDWLRPALDAATMSAVQSSLEAWISWYDASGFINNVPIGNYFAGYLFAKGAAGLALANDYPTAATWWSDVSTRLWPTLAAPAYKAHLAGGGWPEGWEYGPLSVRNITGLQWAAYTAKSETWWTDVPLARDEAEYIGQLTWPSRVHIDDRGTVHAQACLGPQGSVVGMMATILDQQKDAFAATAHGIAADLVPLDGETILPWEQFLFFDPAAASSPVTVLPASYVAPGPGHVAMRSDWTTNATWGSFASGPYIDAPDSGEQYFDEGSLAIAHGNSPVLLNATGWLPQAGGDNGETFVYDDTWGNQTRLLNNVFYVAGSIQDSVTPPQSKTHVERFEDGGVWVRARGAQIEQMYTPAGSVTQYMRDVVYVRPGRFVVFDRTTVPTGTDDQWIAWHVPGAPTQSKSADGTPRFDTTTGGTIRSLMPTAAKPATVDILSGVATRIELHSSAASQDWLTAVTVGETPEVVRLSSADGNVASGGMVGAHVVGASRESVVLLAGDHAGVATAAGAEYTVTQAVTADHLLFDMTPSSTGYAVTATPSGGALTVHVTPGGPLKLTSTGTLAFTVTTAGVVSAEAPPVPPVTPPTTPPGTGNVLPPLDWKAGLGFHW
jgi:hypothetical protein